jgi:hypothetical protein
MMCWADAVPGDPSHDLAPQPASIAGLSSGIRPLRSTHHATKKAWRPAMAAHETVSTPPLYTDIDGGEGCRPTLGSALRWQSAPGVDMIFEPE